MDELILILQTANCLLAACVMLYFADCTDHCESVGYLYNVLT